MDCVAQTAKLPGKTHLQHLSFSKKKKTNDLHAPQKKSFLRTIHHKITKTTGLRACTSKLLEFIARSFAARFLGICPGWLIRLVGKLLVSLRSLEINENADRNREGD